MLLPVHDLSVIDTGTYDDVKTSDGVASGPTEHPPHQLVAACHPRTLRHAQPTSNAPRALSMAKPQPPPVSMLDKHFGTEFLPLYTGTVRVNGGEARHARASGTARSDDGMLDVQLRMPEELGGSGGGTNPEQLFAAAFAGCFHGALSLLATRAQVAIPDAEVVARVSFGRDPMDGMFMLSADIRIRLPGVDRAIAGELVRNTERLCPYAKMARAGIECVVSLDP
jgi:Ohr subfamily peroxiredoxin